MIKKTISIFVVFAFVLISLSGFAQTTNISLNKAVAELQKGNYEAGLAALRRLGKTSNDARIDFYKGFAFEKLGKCVAAQLHYKSAFHAKNKILKETARKTLVGFRGRCKMADGKKVEKVEEPQSYTGWKVAGWTATVLGTALLIATPIKEGFDRDLASKGEPYFLYKHGCRIKFGELETQGCNQNALEKDKRYDQYTEIVGNTKRLNTLGYVSGGVLIGTGLATLLTVALKENSHEIALVPTTKGASVIFKF